MYGRTGRDRRSPRKREEVKEYLRAALWILTIICIIIVCVTMALQTKISQAIAAELEELMNPKENAVVVVVNTDDIAPETNAEQEPAEVSVSDSDAKEEERAIVIDPGHGGADGGCNFGGVLEKDINREIAVLVVKQLRNKGYRVMLARQGDDFVDKEDRVEEANRQNALLYVSIHQNSYKSNSISGIETWYYADDETGESKRLAQLIQQETIEATGAVSRELVADTELCVLTKSNMPACLIETGFLSNKEERAKLCTEEYRELIAEGIVAGIELYLNSNIETSLSMFI